MPPQRLTRPYLRGACVLAATVCLLLAVTATAGAQPNNSGPFTHEGIPILVEDGPVPTTVVRHVDSGPGTIALLVFGAGLAVTFVAGGYLGARRARRTPGAPAS